MPSRRAIAGVAAFAAYLALGFAVSHGAPSELDLLGQSERARFPALALFLTRAGLFPAYLTICVAALSFGLVCRPYLPAATILGAEMLVAWAGSDAFKAIFRRPRPEFYYSIHETSYAYASGHATLSLACYGFLAYVVWRAPLASGLKRAFVAAAGTWILAIGWSRLALGAHYPSDLVGGYLLAIGVLAIATETYDRVRVAGGARP